ncbi:ABC transporter permease, partial [Bacillus spizizenii]|nr:ABC transporter permease [Bacillus spizizenii]
GLGVVSATVLPTPVAIVLTFKELILSGELFGHLQISIYRAALGFL